MTEEEKFETIILAEVSGNLGTFKRGANGGRFATVGGLTVSDHLGRSGHIVMLYDSVGNIISEAVNHELILAIREVYSSAKMLAERSPLICPV